MMTTKELFVKTLKSELPIFAKVLKAVPKGQEDFKPHEKARTAKSIMLQLMTQPVFISKIVNTGLIDFSEPYADPEQDMDGIVARMEENFARLQDDLAALSDEEWENGAFKMAWPGGSMETKKYDMA